MIVDLVRKHFAEHYDIIDIDGARSIFPEGLELVHGSNTGSELIVRCERKTSQALESIKTEIFS